VSQKKATFKYFVSAKCAMFSIIPREVAATGLDMTAIPDQEVVRGYFLGEDYENLSHLEGLDLTLSNHLPTLFYPGCGVDILFPLHYIEKLFPELQEIKFIFVDADSCLNGIKTILADVGVTFTEDLSFYWKGLLVRLEFIQGNVFLMDLPSFDIYFERAFRIMKEGKSFEEKVVAKLQEHGILISDSGFSSSGLVRIPVALDLSSYKEMFIGVK
jgi:hypothetical protein